MTLATEAELNQYGYQLLGQKKVDEAISFVQATLKTDAKNPQLLTTLGTLYAQKNDLARAEEQDVFPRAGNPAGDQPVSHIGSLRWI